MVTKIYVSLPPWLWIVPHQPCWKLRNPEDDGNRQELRTVGRSELRYREKHWRTQISQHCSFCCMFFSGRLQAFFFFSRIINFKNRRNFGNWIHSFHFYRWANWCPERLSDLSKLTQPGKAKIKIRFDFWLAVLSRSHYTMLFLLSV